MVNTNEQQEILTVLEDNAHLLRKTQTNLKKCPKARLTKGYIEARIKIIEDYWKCFKSSHQELVKITPKEQKGLIPYFLNEEFFIYEDLYNVLHGDLKDMLTQLSESSVMDSRVMDTSTSLHHSVIHLPKIQLPTFGGNYEAWPAFQDLFTSLVHDSTALSDVEKLHYLKSSVTAEAESLLKHIPITSSNYSHAWEVLKTRYGNKRLLLNSTMKRLFNQRKMVTQTAVQLKTLLDTTTDCLSHLKNMKINTDSWDPIIIYLLVQKMDPETHKSWEEYAYKDETEALPKWNDLKKFLESKFRTLELTSTASVFREVKPVKERSFHVATSITNKVCVMCNGSHTLCHCKEFIQLEPTKRSEYVKDKHLCFNCLVPGHSVYKCKVPMSCRICRKRHHSLLHSNKVEQPAATLSSLQPLATTHAVEVEEVQANTMITSSSNTKQPVALLATAVVEATSDQGITIPLRALIDQGSQATFISERATQLLQLVRQPIKGSVVGVGSTRTDLKNVVQLQIKSLNDSHFSLPIKAYVMSKQLTARIPAKTIPTQTWTHLEGLKLADPSYFVPGSIDLLLGIKEYTQILEQNFIRGPLGTPCAQKTKLGWILFGEIYTHPQEDTFVVMHHTVDADEILKSFWEIDVDENRHLTKEERLCEAIYENTTTRNQEGRYIVKLPFKTPNPLSPDGNSKDIATRRFMQLEKGFRRSPHLKIEYNKVIHDYIEQGHIEIIREKERITQRSVYLPHHAIVRNDKETSKTRVVFDASCKGTNNISLNDELLVGPQLQEDLRNILMRWRTHRTCFVADIQQMYRQILVTEQDADYQRIVWRPNENEELKEYRLLRVTFGTASAPYLAVKTLQRVAEDEGRDHALACKVIREDFYMDDVLSGAQTVEQATSLAKNVTAILRKGGFDLTKWSSNSKEFLEAIDKNKRSTHAQMNLNLNGTIKTLGIVWDLSADTFKYNLNLSTITTITKRVILSDVQKIFDPLGWIAPSILRAKILLQKIWLERLNWDQNVSKDIQENWMQIRSDFANIEKIRIDRWLGTLNTKEEKVQLHGFSDASMQAYGAAVYLKTETTEGKIETKLIAARTRVAPLKTVSLPRLELCGALLLSRLLKQIGKALRIPTSQMYTWTDSSIVIAWIIGEPTRWKAFVANRVVEIIDNLNSKQWYHVQSDENPADLASRGMSLADLKECDLWWKGPRWLSARGVNISKPVIIETNVEQKPIKINTYINTEDIEPQDTTLISQFKSFKSLTTLITCICYCKRFLNYKKSPNTINSDITTVELEDSLNICIRKAQTEEYSEEIDRIKLKKLVKTRSPLRSLNPYLDEKNILRVGGRLRHASVSEDRKHPIIIGNKNALISLIISDAHLITLHGGVQLMLNYLRSKYWIIKAKSLVKRHIHGCITCAKQMATTRVQMMGDLPKARVTPSRPFLYSGVDFAGPFQTLLNKGRGGKTIKTYIAIFICMSTKAIHLELVGDLTAEAFIGSFRRFVARRGKCSHLWSDQGRNFVGANKELHDAWKEATFQFTGQVATTLATEGTQWHFNPPYSPNFGGLWEAGVKSVKFHLKRILNTHLTYEEMMTILCQIEACLNSRPLCPIDDSNPDPLTPGHFLIGEAPIVVPAPVFNQDKIHSLSRWQYTQKLLNDFWRRWQDEYLSRLQQRPKWQKRQPEFSNGDIVLIKTDNLPPGKWSWGRIVEKHPGPDGITRVYSVKSGDSITKRTVSKLCLLPVNTT